MKEITVSGISYKGYPTPEVVMADMLRYDDGEMKGWTKDETPMALKAHYRFTAIVHSNQFTEARWASFSLKAILTNTLPGKASCKFNDQQSVLTFAHEQNTDWR